MTFSQRRDISHQIACLLIVLEEKEKGSIQCPVCKARLSYEEEKMECETSGCLKSPAMSEEELRRIGR